MFCKLIYTIFSFSFFKNWPCQDSFPFYFRLFKHTLQCLQQINVKNVHLVYNAGIRTHNLWNMSPPITTRPGLLLVFLKKWANPGLFFIYFWSFQTNIITILQQIYVKNVHPVYNTGIRTHDLWNISLFP